MNTVRSTHSTQHSLSREGNAGRIDLCQCQRTVGRLAMITLVKHYYNWGSTGINSMQEIICMVSRLDFLDQLWQTSIDRLVLVDQCWQTSGRLVLVNYVVVSGRMSCSCMGSSWSGIEEGAAGHLLHYYYWMALSLAVMIFNGFLENCL